MKILHLADLHIGNLTHSLLINGKQSKIIDIEEALDEVANYIISNSILYVIIGGDIFHSTVPKPDQIAIFIRFLNKLCHHEIYTYIITGNHDCAILSNALSPVKEFLWEHVYVISEESYNVILRDRDGAVNMIFIPWDIRKSMGENVSDKDYIMNCIKEHVKKDCTNVLVGHFDLEGCTYGSEQEYISKTSQIGFTEEELKNIDLMLLGHIHCPQEFKIDNIPVIYSGTLIKNNFNDKNYSAGFFEVEIKGKDIFSKHIKTNCKEYKEFNLDCNNMSPLIYNLLDVKDAVVKINLNTTKENKYKINIKEVKNTLKKNGIFLLADLRINVVDNIISVRSKEITEQSSPKIALKKHIELNNYGDLKDDIIEEGNKLLEEVE